MLVGWLISYVDWFSYIFLFVCLQGYSTLTCSMGDDGRPGWNRALPSCQGKKKKTHICHSLYLSRIYLYGIHCHCYLFVHTSESPAPCGSRSTGSEGTVLSPNFPRNYTSGQTCIYSISVPREFGELNNLCSTS